MKNCSLEKIEQMMEEPIANRREYILLLKLTVCRLILFNRRRVNEPPRITIAAFADAINKTFHLKKDIDGLNSADLSIVNSLLITFVPAKNSSN